MKNIVILGAGFGGVRCALDIDKKLSGSDWKIILVDRNAYHLYYPKLFEEILPKNEVSRFRCQVLVSEILKGTKVEFVQGEVKGVNCKGRTVAVSTSPPPESSPINGEEQKGNSPPLMGGVRGGWNMSYDYLVLALGAGTDYFGIPGLQEYGRTLKNLEDAMKIREQIAEFIKDSPLGAKRTVLEPFSVVIGGAGATGVEVAAELAYLFRSVPRERWKITIVEALPRVLSMFPNALSQYAHEKLEKLGVHLMLDTCIKSVGGGDGRVEVVLAPRPLKPGEAESTLMCEFLPEKEKRMTAEFLLWAGGVRANPLIAKCGLPTDKKGRMEVDEHLQVKGLEKVFAIGDNALLIDPQSNQPVPATAQAALWGGKIVAQNIKALITGTPLTLYHFKKFPAIVPLSGRDAVALFGKLVIKGWPASFLRHAADCRYFASVIGWMKAIKRCIM